MWSTQQKRENVEREALSGRTNDECREEEDDGGHRRESKGEREERHSYGSEENTSQEVLLVSPRLEAMTAIAGELAWDNGTRLARYLRGGQ